jgi:transcriptional regulator with XRE-family HTH domain
MESSSIANYPAFMPYKKPRNGRKKPDPKPAPAQDAPNAEAKPAASVEPSNPVPVLLGKALRDLRKRYSDSQDDFALRTGRAQSYVSAAERGKNGWDSVTEWANAVRAVGGDPVDLLRLAVAHADESPQLREVLLLWAAAPEHIRHAILTLLRERAGARSEAG